MTLKVSARAATSFIETMESWSDSDENDAMLKRAIGRPLRMPQSELLR